MSTTSAVRIAVLNDYELVVAGVAGALSPFSDRVDVVELDVRTPVISDVDVVLYDTFGQGQGDSLDIEKILGSSGARLLVFSWNTDERLVETALATGASGYVSKSVSAEELVVAIEAVHAGEPVRPEGAGDDDRFGRWPGEEHGLSPREAEVLALICQGLSNQEITERAFIGINTIKTYVRTLYRKIGASNRAQAVIWGVEHGFLPDRTRHLTGEAPR